MTEEIFSNAYRIHIPLPNNPLRELNAFFFRGDDHDLLVDTGFRQPECEEALSGALKELGSVPERRRVLLTHLHADHSGMADLFAGKEQPIFLYETDMQYLDNFFEGVNGRVQHRRFVEGGFPEDLLQDNFQKNPARVFAMPGMDHRLTPLKDGEIIHVGSYDLQTVPVPGHTPGNCMFWIEKEGYMLTSDHILFTITPNITFWPSIRDSLGDYLNSLEKAKTFHVRRAFPSHREEGDYDQRIAGLQAHHARRLSEIENILDLHPDSSAYFIASLMKWRIRANNWDAFPLAQKWFAVGECIAHLDHLTETGRIVSHVQDGIILYRHVA